MPAICQLRESSSSRLDRGGPYRALIPVVFGRSMRRVGRGWGEGSLAAAAASASATDLIGSRGGRIGSRGGRIGSSGGRFGSRGGPVDSRGMADIRGCGTRLVRYAVEKGEGKHPHHKPVAVESRCRRRCRHHHHYCRICDPARI